MDANLIVHYNQKGYLAAKTEVHNFLTKIGDQKEEVDLLVPGIISVKTKIQSRKVVEEVREIYMSDPERMQATIRWAPADFWCDANLEEIKKTIREDIKDLMTAEDTYTIEINEHKSPLKSEDIVQAIAPLLKGKVEYEKPKKILVIELFEKKTAISLLFQKDLFLK